MTRPRLDWIPILLAWTAPLVAAQGGADPAQDQELEVPRAFQVYDSPGVRDRVQSAREHIAAGRWSEALVDLQELLEEYRGEVLPPTRPPLPRGRGQSVWPVFGGAAQWATQALAALPPKARALYAQRHGAQAQRALDAALARGDRAALAQVGRRFPLTPQAVRTWLALGDLEVEQGDLEVGIAAWGRAFSSALRLELDPSVAADWRAALEALEDGQAPDLLASARPRIQIALDHLLGRGELAALTERGKQGTALEPGAELGHLGHDPDSWPRRFDLPQLAENPFAGSAGKHSLYPARSGDTIFVSTSRALFAVGAFTGELLWRTPKSFLGWQDVSPFRIDGFAQAIAFEDSLIHPAVDRGIVVAPLQVPFAFEDEDNYGELEIIRIIPERRLFAFDARDGHPLWDTLPPAGWDGESGDFAERTTIVGPPVIEGTRVLVPAARLRGRIELFVACYDLSSGELIWNTPVLTGQRPLNMFGRLMAEFVAPPVVVSGDRIIVQTQLGTVACLDLFTGDTLWHALYDQIVFTAGSYYSHGLLRSKWRNAPPKVVDGVVVAAPLDCYDLLGIDLESGAVLWTLGHDQISALTVGLRRAAVDVLLGADERRVYLGGRRIVALESPAGLAAGPPSRRAWAYPAQPTERIAPETPRAVIGDRHIYVPRLEGLAVLDRRTGQLSEEMAWGRYDEGNLLLSEGNLFTLSSFGLMGFFEWEAMLRRARAALAAAPDDPRRIEDLSLLLFKRGQSAMLAGDYRRARGYLEDARDQLSPRLERFPTLAATLHRVLRAEARNLRLAADPSEAVGRLRAALPLAPDAGARRDTLLEEQAILLERDFGEWLSVADELDREFGRESIPFLTRETEDGTQGWQGSLQPEVSSLVRSGPGLVSLSLPIGLWIRVERSEGYGRRRKLGDDGRELADLHAILERYADIPLPGGLTAWDWAEERIAKILAGGAPPAYAEFEERAGALLARARSEGDLALLERLPRLYPHSQAAEESNDVRIDLALEAGDAATVASIVLFELPGDWTAAQATERELAHLARLAYLLGAKGNLELRAGLTRALAAERGDVVVDVPAGGATGRGGDGVSPHTLSELAAAWSLPPAASASQPTFRAPLQPAQSYSALDDFGLLGEVPPAQGSTGSGGVRTVQLVFQGSELRAFAGGTPGQEATLLWKTSQAGSGLGRDPLPSDLGQAVTTSAGRIHVATLRRVVTLARETGEALWTWKPQVGRPVAVRAQGGVLVVASDQGQSKGNVHVYRLTGLDVASGIELWHFDLLDDRFEHLPVLGEGRLVLLPKTASPAQVFDLYTGSSQASFELDFSPYRTRAAAWIEGGRIVLPYFLRGQDRRTNQILAFDLDSGRLAWRVSLSDLPGGPRELSEMVSYGDRHFLNLWPVPERGSSSGEQHIGIFELDTRLGALATRPIAEIPESAEPIGIKPYQHTHLDGPYIFLLCEPQTRSEPRFTVRAIHLEYGERWRTRLPAEFLRTPASDLPRPAVSQEAVALGYPLPSSRVGSRRRAAKILVLDRSSGRTLDTLDLPEVTGRSFSLAACGDNLLVARSKLLELLR